jgi:uncharacterized protein (DUF924 family)
MHLTRHVVEPAWVSEVLLFWFQEVGTSGGFARDEAIDAQIRERFLSLYERIVASDGLGATTQRALLAAVIVLDQFPRHLFRGSPLAYAADHLARALSRAAVAQGLDVAMQEPERLFLYLPFEHSEDRADQALAVELIGRLGDEAWTRDAMKHKEIVDRFNRFPHRNAILNRRSSADEIALLLEPEEWF